MSKRRSSPRTAFAVGLGLLLWAGTAAVAAEEPSKWAFEVLSYAWIPGNFGTLNVKGRTADVDVSVRDALEIATSGDAFFAAGYFSAAYDRWSAFVDSFGGFVEESTVEKIPTKFCTLCIAAKAELRPVFVDFALGYRVGQWSLAGRERPITLGVYAGTRFMHFGTKLSGSAGAVGGVVRSADVSESFNWADPLIGARWEIPLIDRLTFDFRGDVGGFGVSSELIWGFVGSFRYWLPWKLTLLPSTDIWLGAGYRLVSFDRDFGAGDSLDLTFRGPYGGLGLAF
jgi:hypothetical protein